MKSFFTYPTNKGNFKPDLILGGYIITLVLFYFGMSSSQADFYEKITEPGFGVGYTPFATRHLPTLLTFLLLANVALSVLWLKEKALPPLLFLTLAALLLIGFITNIAIAIQVSGRSDGGSPTLLILMPIYFCVLSLVLMGKILMSEKVLSPHRKYKSSTLNFFNDLLTRSAFQPFIIILLTLPIFFLVTIVLVVFGQDSHSITKVFTETTTWAYSKENHPAYLPHMGHYLCTVAACGNPKLVKPLGFGTRHGEKIIVNRQLQIANAFEQLIQDHIPIVHNWLRTLYDRHGYPLSKKINNLSRSNTTYILMKPCEYLFLIVLYLFCIKPEIKIAKQYLLIVPEGGEEFHSLTS